MIVSASRTAGEQYRLLRRLRCVEHRRILPCQQHDHRLRAPGCRPRPGARRGRAARSGRDRAHGRPPWRWRARRVGLAARVPGCRAAPMSFRPAIGGVGRWSTSGARPRVRRCSGAAFPPSWPRASPSAAASRSEKISHDANHQGERERERAERHRDAWADERVILHRDGKRRPADGRPGRETRRRSSHGAHASHGLEEVSMRLTPVPEAQFLGCAPQLARWLPIHDWECQEKSLTAAASRGDAGEVLRQASAVLGRPVILWESPAHTKPWRAPPVPIPNLGAAVPTLRPRRDVARAGMSRFPSDPAGWAHLR